MDYATYYDQFSFPDSFMDDLGSSPTDWTRNASLLLQFNGATYYVAQDTAREAPRLNVPPPSDYFATHGFTVTSGMHAELLACPPAVWNSDCLTDDCLYESYPYYPDVSYLHSDLETRSLHPLMDIDVDALPASHHSNSAPTSMLFADPLFGFISSYEGDESTERQIIAQSSPSFEPSPSPPLYYDSSCACNHSGSEIRSVFSPRQQRSSTNVDHFEHRRQSSLSHPRHSSDLTTSPSPPLASPAASRRNAPAWQSVDDLCIAFYQNNFQCAVDGCPFAPVDVRQGDVLRHMETHRLKDKWVCCGTYLEDALQQGIVPRISEIRVYKGRQMVGGCFKAFSRRDSLKRHLENGRIGCLGDIVLATQLSEY